MADDLRRRVALERKLRYPSDRAAADAGGVSNQTWSRFMKGADVTDGIRQAVARAFGWPADWPENPPPSPVRATGSDDTTLILDAIAGATEDASAVLESIDRRLAILEKRLARSQRRDAGASRDSPSGD